jgi:hypothetical protein
MGLLSAFFGEDNARKLKAFFTYHLTGKIDGNTAINLEEAKIAADEMSAKIVKQEAAVAKLSANSKETMAAWKEQFDEHEKLMADVKAHKEHGRMDAAREVLGEARSIRQFLPQMAEMAEAAKQMADLAEAELNEHRAELKKIRLDLKNYAGLQRVKASQDSINEAKQEFTMGNSKAAFERAGENIKRGAIESFEMGRLLTDPSKKMLSEARHAALNDDLDSELAALGEPPAVPMIEAPKEAGTDGGK